MVRDVDVKYFYLSDSRILLYSVTTMSLFLPLKVPSVRNDIDFLMLFML